MPLLALNKKSTEIIYPQACSRKNISLKPIPKRRHELELELIQTQMTQKPVLRAEVHARALRASHEGSGAHAKRYTACVFTGVNHI